MPDGASTGSARGDPRIPPHNFEAEMGLLGAILANNGAYERVAAFLKPEHFADGVHAEIYRAAGLLIEQGTVADAVTLRGHFEREGALERIGGPAYLAQLAASMVTFVNAEDYGRTVRDRWLRRELISLAEDLAERARDAKVENPAELVLEATEASLFALAGGEASGRGAKALRGLVDDAMKRIEAAHREPGRMIGVTTGLTALDKLLGGLRRQQLVVVGGRPSMGKTALACGIAHAAAAAAAAGKETGAAVAFFSHEMAAEEIADRLIGARARVAVSEMHRGGVEPDGIERLARLAGPLGDLPVFIDDAGGLSANTVAARARRLKRLHNIGLVIVDYLQLVRADGWGQGRNRVAEIGEIVRGMKALAKSLDIPVLLLSQLSRQVEQRDDKRPLLSDLRESGDIEQDADVVLFPYRESYYVKRAQPERPRANESEAAFDERVKAWEKAFDRAQGRAEIYVAKHRNGAVRPVRCDFDEKLMLFGDEGTLG